MLCVVVCFDVSCCDLFSVCVQCVLVTYGAFGLTVLVIVRLSVSIIVSGGGRGR